MTKNEKQNKISILLFKVNKYFRWLKVNSELKHCEHDIWKKMLEFE